MGPLGRVRIGLMTINDIGRAHHLSLGAKEGKKCQLVLGVIDGQLKLTQKIVADNAVQLRSSSRADRVKERTYNDIVVPDSGRAAQA